MPFFKSYRDASGIGAELAKLFAADGDDVVLVARSEDKLHELAEQLRSKHSIRATVIAADLALPEQVDRLGEVIESQSIQVDTLVNNAGFGALGKFAELPAKWQSKMLMVNVVALTRLTHRFGRAVCEAVRFDGSRELASMGEGFVDCPVVRQALADVGLEQ